MYLNDLIDDANRQIRDHHRTGHFTYAEAHARLTANGLAAGDAAYLLTRPTGDDREDSR